MDHDAPIAESSPAPTEQAPVALRSLDSLNESELATWRLTGDLPAAQEDASTPAESTPAEPAAQAASTDAQDPAPASEPGTQGKKKSTAADRVQELLAERAQLREEVARLKGQPQNPPPSTPSDAARAASSPAASVGEPFPKFDAWAARPENADRDFEDYTQALVAHALEQRELRQREQAAIEGLASSFAARFQAAAEADPSFIGSLSEDVLGLTAVHQLPTGVEPTAANYVASEITQSEHAVALLRHFSAHPAELAALKRGSPASAIRAVAKLEARFEAASSSAPPPAPATPSAPVVTKAPDPPRTLGARSAAPLNEIDAAVANRDFRAFRDAANREEMAARSA